MTVVNAQDAHVPTLDDWARANMHTAAEQTALLDDSPPAQRPDALDYGTGNLPTQNNQRTRGKERRLS